MIYRSVEIEENFDLNNICRGDGFLQVATNISLAPPTMR
jgi:hypothetical protein